MAKKSRRSRATKGFLEELISNHFSAIMFSSAVIFLFSFFLLTNCRGSLPQALHLVIGIAVLPAILYSFFLQGVSQKSLDNEKALIGEEFKKKQPHLRHVPLTYNITFFLFLLVAYGAIWGTIYVSKHVGQLLGGYSLLILLIGLYVRSIIGLNTALFEIFFETQIEMGGRSIPTMYKKSPLCPKIGYNRIIFFATILCIHAGLLIMARVFFPRISNF